MKKREHDEKLDRRFFQEDKPWQDDPRPGVWNRLREWLPGKMTPEERALLEFWDNNKTLNRMAGLAFCLLFFILGVLLAPLLVFVVVIFAVSFGIYLLICHPKRLLEHLRNPARERIAQTKKDGTFQAVVYDLQHGQNFPRYGAILGQRYLLRRGEPELLRYEDLCFVYKHSQVTEHGTDHLMMYQTKAKRAGLFLLDVRQNSGDDFLAALTRIAPHIKTENPTVKEKQSTPSPAPKKNPVLPDPLPDHQEPGTCQMCHVEGTVTVCRIPKMKYDYDLCPNCMKKYRATPTAGFSIPGIPAPAPKLSDQETKRLSRELVTFAGGGHSGLVPVIIAAIFALWMLSKEPVLSILPFSFVALMILFWISKSYKADDFIRAARDQGVLNTLLTDFQKGRRYLNDRIILGSTYLLGKGCPCLVRVEELNQIFVDRDDSGDVTEYWLNCDTAHDRIRVKIPPLSKSSLTQLIRAILSRNPEVEIGELY